MLLFLLAGLFLPCQDPAARAATAVRKAVETGSAADLQALGNETLRKALPVPRLEKTFRLVLEGAGEVGGIELDPAGWPLKEDRHLVRIEASQRNVLIWLGYDEDLLSSLWMNYEADRWDAERLGREADGWKGDWGWAAVRIPAEGDAVEVSRHRGREVFPLGSMFKVYVLAELARQIAAGERSWDEPLAVRDEWKSLPSGITHKDPEGTVFPVRVWVQRMIGLSDNTATDHLLHTLGREKVEAILEPAMNSVADRNRPFLSTMEMFRLKGTPEGSAATGGDLGRLARAWGAGTVAERRRLLRAMEEALAGRTPAQQRTAAGVGYGMRTLGQPGHVEIEWFARPGDLARLYGASARGAFLSPEASEAFREGLGFGQPVYFAPGVEWQGFKGGNETGLLGFSGLVRQTDGSWVAACVCRTGWPALDSTVLEKTARFYAAVLRAASEGRLSSAQPQPAAAAGGG